MTIVGRQHKIWNNIQDTRVTLKVFIKVTKKLCKWNLTFTSSQSILHDTLCNVPSSQTILKRLFSTLLSIWCEGPLHMQSLQFQETQIVDHEFFPLFWLKIFLTAADPIFKASCIWVYVQCGSSFSICSTFATFSSVAAVAGRLHLQESPFLS